jgi:RNA polymerase sigma factor (sigma-70 family)
VPRSRRGARTDEQLARAAGRGDVAAFEALYTRHHLALLSFSRHMLGRAHDAEDVVQHTFLAADRTFRSGKVPKAVRAWLYTVARNRCVSVLRGRREDARMPDADVPSTENLAADVEQRADLRDLLGDLRTLPDDQRAALLLTELGDLTHAEVAKVIGVRTGKVKALVFQAREALLASAHARAIPCHSIREELATATGAALRRRHLRNHVAQCETCRDYAAAVRAQRAALAAILPVVPTLALRDGVLSGFAAGGGTAAAGAGAGIGAGVLAKATAAKVLTTIAVGGAAAGGGVAVTALDGPAPAPAPVERQAERAPVAGDAPAVSRLAPPGSTVAGPSDAQGGPAGRGATPDRRARTAPGQGRREGGDPPGHARREGGPPPGHARRDGGDPPGQARRDGGSPPGHARRDGGDPPGQARREGGSPPGHARREGGAPPPRAKIKTPPAKAPRAERSVPEPKPPKAVAPKAVAPTDPAPPEAAPEALVPEDAATQGSAKKNAAAVEGS